MEKLLKTAIEHMDEAENRDAALNFLTVAQQYASGTMPPLRMIAFDTD